MARASVRLGTIAMEESFDPYSAWLGIPRDEQPPNHYRLLDLRPLEDEPEKIRSAVMERTERLRKYQLSKHVSECQALLNEIAAASVCLLDPDRKADYDARLRVELARPDAADEKSQEAVLFSVEGKAESARGADSPAVVHPEEVAVHVAAGRPRRRNSRLQKLLGAAVVGGTLVLVAGAVWWFGATRWEPHAGGQTAMADGDSTEPTEVPSPPSATPRNSSQPDEQRSPEVPPPSLPPAAWVDLLGDIDMKRDVVEGKWRLEADGLTHARGLMPRIMLPVVVEGDYDLEVEFTRTSGSGAARVFFPVEWQTCSLVFAPTKNFSGLTRIGNWGVGPSNPTFRELFLQNGRRYRTMISVRLDGGRTKISVMLNDEPHINWDGRLRGVGLHPRASLPNRLRPGLGGGEALVFHRARIRVVDDGTTPGKLQTLEPGDVYDEPFRMTKTIGNPTGSLFYDFAPPGAHLVGFRCTCREILHVVQPIYRTASGTVEGHLHGGLEGDDPGDRKDLIVVAKEGYAVGGVWVSALHKEDPKVLSGLQVAFMRVRESQLDPGDSYTSDWVGQNAKPTYLAADESLVTGIFGAWNGSGVSALGLVMPRQ